jgi:gluconolactonase
MKSKAILVVLFSLICAVAYFGQNAEKGGRGGGGRGQAAGKKALTRLDQDKVTPEIPGVVKAGTKIEIVNTAQACGDGGVGMADGTILASCRPGVSKIAPDGTTTRIVEDSEQAAGLTIDPQGRIIGAQYTKKVSVLYPTKEVLTDSFEGKSYIRPNDLVADKKGGVYFTDCYQVGVEPKPDDPPQAIYYIAPNTHKVTRVSTDVRRPNGITLSADDKTLYVNDWDGSYLVTFDVQPDGSLKNRKNFGKYTLKEETDHGPVSGADGLCMDSKGNTFATTPAGVQVFNAKGEHLGDIEAPYDQPPQNCGFGGPDNSYLYVTGRGVVYRIHTMNPGNKNRGK